MKEQYLTDIPVKKYVEMIASFAVERDLAPAFDLLVGFHPDEKRMMFEDEECYPIDLLRYCRREDLINEKYPNNMEKLSLLWLKYFPMIDQFISLKQNDFWQALWKIILERTEVINLSYAFYPVDFKQDNFQYNHCRVHKEANLIQRRIEKMSERSLKSKGRVVWTFPFPSLGPIGTIIEEKIGLSTQLKRKVGLTDHTPGLICNFLLYNDLSVDDLDPYQFEDLTGIILASEGWEIIRMPRTRDGGKDIIAKTKIDGKTFVAYIQAKRYSPKRRVGISVVKEFVATVAGDKVDKGMIVSTSSFSKPCINWLSKKGISLATIELLDRGEIEKRMAQIADSDVAVYILKS
jgi:hypothetical protein